jgi:hypothetical protein
LALDRKLSVQYRRVVTFPLIAAFCGMGILINSTVGVFWGEASEIQASVFSRLRNALPLLPQGATVLIYGLCPYHGPAPVFTSNWDLAGRLALDTGDRSLLADIITQKSRYGPQGVVNQEYDVDSTYRYGKMYVYDVRDDLVQKLEDQSDARKFFDAHPIADATNCVFFDGFGVALF